LTGGPRKYKSARGATLGISVVETLLTLRPTTSFPSAPSPVFPLLRATQAFACLGVFELIRTMARPSFRTVVKRSYAVGSFPRRFCPAREAQPSLSRTPGPAPSRPCPYFTRQPDRVRAVVHSVRGVGPVAVDVTQRVPGPATERTSPASVLPHVGVHLRAGLPAAGARPITANAVSTVGKDAAGLGYDHPGNLRPSPSPLPEAQSAPA